MQATHPVTIPDDCPNADCYAYAAALAHADAHAFADRVADALAHTIAYAEADAHAHRYTIRDPHADDDPTTDTAY